MGNEFGRLAPEVLLDAIRDYAIIELDVDGRIRSWNAGAEAVLGYSSSQVVGQPVAILHVGSNPTQEARELLDATRARGRVQGTGWRRRQNGSLVWVEASIGVVLDDTGSPIGFAKIVRDATAQYRTEEMLRGLIDSTEFALITTNVEGVITQFNPAAERLLGYESREAIGTLSPLTFHDPGEIAARGAALTAELMHAVEPNFDTVVAWTREREGADERPWTYVRKDGGRVPVLVSATALRDPFRVVTGYLFLARDMSELNRARREVAEQEERRRLVFEATDDAVFVIDERGTILEVSPAATRIFGWEERELLGNNVRLLMPAEDAAQHDHYIERFSETGEARVAGQGREVEGQRKNGSRFAAELRVNPTTYHDRRVFVGTLRDITARRAVEDEHTRLLQVVENSSEAITVSDSFGNYVYRNGVARELFGTETELGLAPNLSKLHAPDLLATLRAGAWTTQASLEIAETTLQHPTEGDVQVAGRTTVHRNHAGEVQYLSTVLRDLRAQKRTEALLGKVAAQVRGMLYQMIVCTDGRVTCPFVSAGSRELFGVEPHEVATDITKLVPKEEFAALFTSLRAAQAELQPWSAEFQVTRDGTKRWYRTHATPERLPNGDISWYGLTHEVTGEHRLFQELSDSKRALEDAISVLNAGFAMFDADERLVVCNRAYIELYHLSTELVASHPTYEQIIRTQLRQYPQFQIPGDLAAEAWIATLVRDFRKPSHSAVTRLGDSWVRMEQRKTQDGGTVCLREDVTNLKAAEFEARLQEQRLQLATKAAGIGIWDTDLATGRLSWDARMEEIYQFAPGTFPQTLDAWKSRIHPDDLPAVEAALARSLEAGEDTPLTYRIVLPDGSIRHIERRGTHIRGADGKLVRRLGVNVDITHQVQTESTLRNALSAALAATKAKGEFMATMSHEIRTPLNAVIGMTGLLLATQLDTAQREYAETIRSSGEGLLTLINDILDFSKIEAGKLELENVPVAVAQLVRECVDLFKEQAKGKGLQLRHELGSSDITTLGDPTRIRQIVLNLLSNAVKFTHRGSVSIALDFHSSSRDETLVQLQVRDTGIGMSAEYVARLGEAFSQADSSTTRRFGGTGLGLSICRSLVQLMHGTWSVDSTPNQGTTFTVKLPMTIARERSKPPAIVSDHNGEPLLDRVLVVDDNVVNQRVVSLMLRKLVHQVELAMDGREAVDKVRSTSYDCIFMDGQMPEMDGMEATRRIRIHEQEAGRPRTPIVALTANALPGDRDSFLEAGMDHYLTKPVRQTELVAALASVASRRRRL